MTAPDRGAWRRLDRRMLLIHPIQEIPRALPALLAAFVAGNGSGRGLIWIAVALAITLGFAFSRWFTTRYRVTEDRVEVSSGLLPAPRARRLARPHPDRRRHRARDAPAARARPRRGRHRALGPRGRRRRAARRPHRGRGRRRCARSCCTARRQRRRPRRPAAGAPTEARPRRRPRSSSRAWIRAGSATRPSRSRASSPSAWSLGFLAQRRQRGALRSRATGARRAMLADRLGHAPVVLAAVALAALALVAVVVASTVGYALAFWDFRLTRHPGGTLHVTRGLITTRATTIEERRLHGVEVSEPLLLRMVAGARLIAIATGLRVGRGAERGGSLLVPPAPRAEVRARGRRGHRGRSTPLTCPLAAHGPRARARRYTRALGGWALLVAALAVVHWAIGGPAWLPVRRRSRCCPSPLLLAADRYRNLGHAVADGRLVARSGSLVRRRCRPGGRGHHRLERRALVLPAPRGPGDPDGDHGRRPPALRRAGRRARRGAARRRGARARARRRRSSSAGRRSVRQPRATPAAPPAAGPPARAHSRVRCGWSA